MFAVHFFIIGFRLKAVQKYVLTLPFLVRNDKLIFHCLLFGCIACQQEEDEVPDDETVNQMIARSEEEFEQFMVCLVHFPNSRYIFFFLQKNVFKTVNAFPSAHGSGPTP